MTEPDVVLTDYALAGECAVLATLLVRHAAPSALRGWFLVYFAALGVAAAAGGTVHGFYLDPGSAGARVLWPVTLLVVGLAAWASWAIGARLVAPERSARLVTALAGALWGGYAAMILTGARAFAIAVIHYVPAALFLLLAFAWRGRDPGGRAGRLGAWGVGVSLLAAGIQQAGIGLHPTWLSPNALAHVVQGVALLLLFAAARALAGSAAPRRTTC